MIMVICIAGEGGHLEQMRRLINLLNIEKDVLVISDSDKCNKFFNHTKVVPEIRSKYKVNHILSVYNLVKIFIFSLYDLYKLKPKVIISTGPGICIPYALAAKFFRCKFIYIETWSRFYSLSKTGKVCIKLADIFYVQNKSLMDVSTKVIYSGRL